MDSPKRTASLCIERPASRCVVVVDSSSCTRNATCCRHKQGLSWAGSLSGGRADPAFLVRGIDLRVRKSLRSDSSKLWSVGKEATELAGSLLTWFCPVGSHGGENETEISSGDFIPLAALFDQCPTVVVVSYREPAVSFLSPLVGLNSLVRGKGSTGLYVEGGSATMEATSPETNPSVDHAARGSIARSGVPVEWAWEIVGFVLSASGLTTLSPWVIAARLLRVLFSLVSDMAGFAEGLSSLFLDGRLPAPRRGYTQAFESVLHLAQPLLSLEHRIYRATVTSDRWIVILWRYPYLFLAATLTRSHNMRSWSGRVNELLCKSLLLRAAIKTPCAEHGVMLATQSGA